MVTTPTPPDWDDIVNEVRRVWGDQLRPAKEVYRGLSRRTQDFLTTVGLPSATPGMGVACLHDVQDQPILRSDRQYVVVAEESGTSMRYAIDVKSDQVYLVTSATSRNPPDFHNTNIALFVLFLGVFVKDIFEASQSVEEGSDEAYAITTEARALLTAMDPEAMRAGSPWESLMRELEY